MFVKNTNLKPLLFIGVIFTTSARKKIRDYTTFPFFSHKLLYTHWPSNASHENLSFMRKFEISSWRFWRQILKNLNGTLKYKNIKIQFKKLNLSDRFGVKLRNTSFFNAYFHLAVFY